MLQKVITAKYERYVLYLRECKEMKACFSRQLNNSMSLDNYSNLCLYSFYGPKVNYQSTEKPGWQVLFTFYRQLDRTTRLIHRPQQQFTTLLKTRIVNATRRSKKRRKNWRPRIFALYSMDGNSERCVIRTFETLEASIIVFSITFASCQFLCSEF